MRCRALEDFYLFFYVSGSRVSKELLKMSAREDFKLLIDLQHSLSHSVRSCARCFL